MSKINVVDMAGKVVSELELNDAVFGIEPNKSVLHDSVKNHLANCRQSEAPFLQIFAEQEGKTARYQVGAV